MFDKSKISKEQHNNFIAKLNKDETKLYLMVKRNKFIGVYSLVDIFNSSGRGVLYL